MPAPALKKQKLDKTSASASIPVTKPASQKKTATKSKQTKPPAATAAAEAPSSSDDDASSELSGGSDAEDEYDLAEAGSDDGTGSEAGGSGDDPDDLEGLTLRKQSKKRKRNDPDAFSTSMAKILSSHLTTTARKDPILVRSKKAAQQIDESRLEAKARRLLTLEHKKAMEKGRIKDLIPQNDADGDQVKATMEKEKALRKLAQRGVIKLFNAVRAAQVTGAQALEEAKSKGVVGMEARDKKVTEMSKQGFLDLIRSSSKAKA